MKDIKILELEGSPYEMGFQHGEALKEEIKDIPLQYKNFRD